MRRIISLFLILAVLSALRVNILAGEEPEAIMTDNYILYENDVISMIVTDAGNGQSLVAWLEKTIPPPYTSGSVFCKQRQMITSAQ